MLIFAYLMFGSGIIKRVVIIGGGPAGLTAGYELLKLKKYKVIIIESESIVGGISKTLNHNGNRIDFGGHRFFTKNNKVKKLWNEIFSIQGYPAMDDKILNVKKNFCLNGPDPEVVDEVFLIRNRVSRIYYSKKFFDYPVKLNFNTIKNLGTVQTVKGGFSYLKSNLIKKKENSLEDFYINRFGKIFYSTFFEKYTEKLWGRHPSDISPEWGAQRVKGLSISTVIKNSVLKTFNIENKKKETSLIEEYIYPKYGPGQFWDEMAKKILENGGEILLQHEVVSIEKDNNIIKSVMCKTKDGTKKIKGDIFISSMPIKDLIVNMNGVPKKVYDIAANLPYRDFVTVGVLVEKLKIKNRTATNTLSNIIPDCWIYVQEPNIKMGRIQIFNNWSPYMLKNPEKEVWLGLEYFCNENDSFWNMNEKDIIDFAINELVIMGFIDKCDVIDSCCNKLKKAYPAYFDIYNNFDKVKNYLNKINNLYCIGRNGQHKYNNMDHSMLTAIEAVENISKGIKKKDNIWNVNAEKKFHEEKRSDECVCN